jgi:hypothetical protein
VLPAGPKKFAAGTSASLSEALHFLTRASTAFDALRSPLRLRRAIPLGQAVGSGCSCRICVVAPGARPRAVPRRYRKTGYQKFGRASSIAIGDEVTVDLVEGCLMGEMNDAKAISHDFGAEVCPARRVPAGRRLRREHCLVGREGFHAAQGSFAVTINAFDRNPQRVVRTEPQPPAKPNRQSPELTPASLTKRPLRRLQCSNSTSVADRTRPRPLASSTSVLRPRSL